MQVSQKCKYTLRALFELAKRQGDGPVSAAEIATAQALPPRFLELILHSLTKSGEVKSRRGIRGGYVLAVSPTAITVGDVVRLVDGSAAPGAPASRQRKAGTARSMASARFLEFGPAHAKPSNRSTTQPPCKT